MSRLLALRGVPLVLLFLAQLTPAAEDDGDWDEVFFLGDSDIEYWDTDQDFPGSQNEGVGGWTCKKVLKQLDNLLPSETPPWAILVCGENDFYSRSPEETFPLFKQIVEALVARNMRVIYMGTKPEPDTRKLHDEYRSYDDMVRAYASQQAEGGSAPPLVMVDVYKGFEALGNPRSLYAGDGLHLSNEGYSHWNEWAKQALDETVPCVEYRGGQCVVFPDPGCAPSMALSPESTASPFTKRCKTVFDDASYLVGSMEETECNDACLASDSCNFVTWYGDGRCYQTAECEVVACKANVWNKTECEEATPAPTGPDCESSKWAGQSNKQVKKGVKKIRKGNKGIKKTKKKMKKARAGSDAYAKLEQNLKKFENAKQAGQEAKWYQSNCL